MRCCCSRCCCYLPYRRERIIVRETLSLVFLDRSRAVFSPIGANTSRGQATLFPCRETFLSWDLLTHAREATDATDGRVSHVKSIIHIHAWIHRQHRENISRTPFSPRRTPQLCTIFTLVYNKTQQINFYFITYVEPKYSVSRMS